MATKKCEQCGCYFTEPRRCVSCDTDDDRLLWEAAKASVREAAEYLRWRDREEICMRLSNGTELVYGNDVFDAPEHVAVVAFDIAAAMVQEFKRRTAREKGAAER